MGHRQQKNEGIEIAGDFPVISGLGLGVSISSAFWGPVIGGTVYGINQLRKVSSLFQT